MGVITVQGPVSGRPYRVNISGEAPTPEEQGRIDQFVAQNEAPYVQLRQQFFGQPQAQPVEEEEEIDRTAFGRGFVREPFQRERSFGVVEEALADTAFGKFFGFDAEEARAKQEAAEAELRRLELEDPSIRFEDITGLGTAASVSGEALGGEARDMAIQAGATATGAGIGGLFFGAGAVPGAAIGRTAGVAYTTAQAAPQMLAEAIEAQKEEGNEVNLTKALGATAINLLSEFVTDYFVIGKLIPREAKSKVGSAVRSAIEAGTAEGATEVFQQAVIRGQAGQDLTSPEAIAEYAESLYLGMTVGGTIGGVGGFLSTPDRSAEKELDDDLKELREYGLAGFKFAEETEKDIEAQRNAALGAVGIDLDAPLQIGTDGAPLALPAPDAAEIAPKPVIADTEFENLSFNKAQYERVLQQVKADITSGKPINIPAIQQRVKSDIPGTKVSQVRDIMNELKARGFVAENPASKKNKFIAMGSLAPEVKTPDVSYRRQIDSAADFIKADQTRLERLQYDLRSAEAYGRDLEGNRVTPNQVNATISRVEQRIAENQQRIEASNQRLQSLGQDTHVPRFEKVGLPPGLKAVPVAEGTPDALRPRFEAQQASIRGMKEQLNSVNRQVRKLNDQAKKRTLSSNELDRMQRLQEQQAEVSTRLGEAQANLKTPEKIFQEAKGEQFREQERQREIERKLAAARARAAADQVKAQEDQGVSPVTPAFNAKQTRVFDALKKRLSNLGLKDVKLEGVQKIKGGEGFFDPVTKTITLAMGMYDPNMNDQQLFDAISEVMNHEVIHALRAMGVLKPNEMKVLERLAEKTKYVKRTKEGTQKRNYTYLDRAKSLYSDYTPTQQKEEAIAEMFRDYIAGRLKLGGGPRALFEKIKKFFKALVGTNVDEGFTRVEDIFQGIRRGEIGARDRVAPAAQPAAAAPMQSRVVPQTSREQLNAAVSTSDDYMQDAPADQRPLFSRIPRSPSVGGLRDFIRKNPDGFTIDATTFDPAAGGFVVAPLKEAEIIVGQDLPEEVLLGYVEDNKDIARASGRTVYLGGWFDGESQQYFLDNTLIVPTAEEALYIAEAADQLAIFDLNNFEEIRTNAGIEQLKQSGSYRSDAAVGYQRNLAEIGRRFAEARDQRRARIQEQLVGGLERPRQSRLTVPMTAEQRAASIIDYLNPNTGKPLFKKKPGSETLVSFANKLLELRGTRPYNIVTSEEDRQAVAQIMAAEAEAALLSSRDALGWYDSTLKLAKQILYPVYPEVSPTRPDGTANPMYEPAAEHAFDYATAVTSNGMAVVDNYQFAAEQYDAWKASTDGKFPVVGKGDQGGSMLKAFEFWNALTDLGYDSNAISELLMTQLPRSEVNNLLKDVFGVRTLKELPAVADTKEEADTIVSVAYVIGPKIGNGFYQNLRGNFDPLTMDRWWMRFVNRITGNPLAIQTEESIASSVDRLWQLVSKPRSLTKMERDILRRAQENLNMTKLEKSDIALLSAEVEKVWNKYFFNKAQNDKLRDLLNEGMDFEIVGGSVRGPEAELAKRLAREARPEKPELALAATNLAKKVKPALEEAPRDARDRTAMRDVANRAREILRRSNQIGADLTNADFQALMWYAEKRIFDAGGVKRGRGEDNDYADGAIAIAKAKGISDAKIEAALPESERGRVSGIKSQLAGDQDAGGKVGELVREPQEGDFFSPRRLTLVAESDSIEANMTPQERAEVREALQGAEIDPEMPRQMYSRIPVAESYMPTRAPVDSKAGPTPIYGSIMEEGRLLPVVLQKGSHRVYENGVEVGNGLFHIQQRQYDRELIENSKYKRVENAIYDLMRRWQNQGYDDGEAVIGYNSREGLVLEWRNNLAFSAPPMRLVLERGSNVQGAPLADAYYVKTFFPLLERQNRKTQPQRGRALVDEVSADSRRMLSRLYSTTAPSQGTPQFGPSDLETAMQNMRYAGVQDKFASIFKKIGKPFKVDEKAIEDGTQWVFNKLQDNFVSVGKMYDALRKQGANIPRDMDAYFQELLMHGVTGAKKTNFKAEEFTPVVERVARLNVTDTERDALKRVSGYYDQILEKTGNKSHALTNAYLYALHALERNQRISELSKGQIANGSGMSNQEAQNIIAFANSMDAQRAAELRNIAAAVQGMISGTNDTYIEGGLIPDYKDDADVDDKTRQAFTKYKNYVPLRGFADPESDLDVSAGGFSTTNRFGALGSPNKKALGRESYAGDILANVAVQRENAIDKAERNKVGVAVLNLLESDVNTDAYAEVLLRHPLRRVMRNGRITVMPDRDFSNPDLPILAVRRGGEEVLIGFKDPRLAAAFKGTSAKQMNAVMSGLHSFTRLYANLLTSWNPAFLLGNWPRDIETALFNAQQYNMEGSSKDIIKNVGPSFKAIMKVLNNKEGADPYWANRYKQFYDNGGQNVLNQMGDVVNNSKDIRDTISKIVTADEAGNRILTKALWTSTKKGVGSLANYVEGVNTAVENSTRLAFFDAVVRNLEAQGVPTERALREAAVAARQLTTNFAKGGEMKTAFNTFYLFFNASLQGSMAMFTSLVNNPKGRKLVAGVITAGFVMELLNGAISGDEDDDGIKDYDNLGDYKLSHSIVLPDLNGDGTFVSIPLAYGINMFYNFGRVMGNMARGAMGDGGTYTPQEAAASTVGTVVESFNPFGGNNFWTFAAPTQLDLPVELMTNRNFMDGPIYKELSPFEQYKSRSSLYWSTTSPSAVWVSKFINDNIGGGSDIIPGEVLGKRVDIQPDVIEHIIDFMLGGAGKFVLQMGEAATTYAPAAMMGDFEEDMIRRTPILNKFLTAVTEKDRSGDFYEKRDDVLAVYADLKDAIDNGDRERALAIRERYAEYLPLIGPIRSINNEIRKLNTLRRNVNANASLSQERKREILDRLEERIAAYVSRGNQLMLSI
jgi:gas vesicle protein